MGWRGTLRSINAASNRAARESQKRQNSLHRTLAKIQRSSEAVTHKADMFEKQLVRDPIKALGLRFSRDSGFEAAPFPIKTEIFSGSVALVSQSIGNDQNSAFEPPFFADGGTAVKPLQLLFSRWGTFVAIDVRHQDAEWRMRLNWFKKNDSTSSLVFLLDTENSEYYYPITTDLKGEVVAGHPRLGVLGFAPFRKPTRQIELHFSSVDVHPGRNGKRSFSFKASAPEIHTLSHQVSLLPSLADQVKSVLAAEEAKAMALVQKAYSGCCLLLGLLGSGAVALACAWWTILFR